jgi:hypothetical protein
VKRAVIVVGRHYAGKSRTIKQFFKPLVGISGNRRFFQIGAHDAAVLSQSLEERFRNGRDGHVLSQSLEEKRYVDVRRVVATYDRYARLVFAARPRDEAGSLYEALKSELEGRDFSVATVTVVRGRSESFYAERAQEILRHLQ